MSADEARRRWAALKRFYQKHGHWLATNGPYLLERWSPDAVVLSVFRDLSYPLGLGSFDRYAIPRRACVSRTAVRGDRLEVYADVERLMKYERNYTLVREPLRRDSGSGLDEVRPVCRYVAVDSTGHVVRAGTAARRDDGVFLVDLKGMPGPEPHTVLVAVYLNENFMNAGVRAVRSR